MAELEVNSSGFRSEPLRFEPVTGWGTELPDLMTQDVSDITVGPGDQICLLYRDLRSVIVATTQGTPRRVLATPAISQRVHGHGGAHGVSMQPDGTCYVVDDGNHCVHVFDPSGDYRGSFGSGPSNPELPRIARGYPPFCRPTRLAFSGHGEFYVSDGYGNARVHRFSARHDLLTSWGEPGSAAGEFATPHSVLVDSRGRVLVCDRENDRVQVFTADGQYLEEWSDFHRPQAIVEDQEGYLFVAEGARPDGYVSPRHGPMAATPSRVSVLSPNGDVVTTLGGVTPGEPGSLVAAHGIAVDAHGDLYVAEVSASVLSRWPVVGLHGWPAVQKFRRLN